jgi:sarcosine oxidase
VEFEWDVVVAGLGVMGAAATWELASRGLNVLAIDQFAPLHAMGSSHGSTRIIREAYFEHPLYVPLVHRAWERWQGLEQATGSRLLQHTGGLNITRQDSDFLHGLMRSVTEHDLQHEFLDHRAIIARYPALRPEPGSVGVFEPRASVLFAEPCVAALHAAAQTQGATLRFNEEMLSWESVGGGVYVETASATVRTRKLVLALGAWMPAFAPFPLSVERQTVFWFEPAARPETLLPGALPITLWEYAPGQLAYAFPDLGSGVKASRHHQGEACTVETLDRDIRPDDETGMRRLLEGMLPDAAGGLRAATVCMYTNTPDSHFLVDTHPATPEVTLLSACSGHGFKFAPAIAENVADLVQEKEPAFDLAPFSGARRIS